MWKMRANKKRVPCMSRENDLAIYCVESVLERLPSLLFHSHSISMCFHFFVFFFLLNYYCISSSFIDSERGREGESEI